MNPSAPTLSTDPRFAAGHRPYRGVGSYDTAARRDALSAALNATVAALDLAHAADPDAEQAFPTAPGTWAQDRTRARAALRAAVEAWAGCAVAAIDDGPLPVDAVKDLIKHATTEAARAQRGLSAEWMEEVQATLGQILANPLGASGSALRLAAAHCRTLVDLMNDPAGYRGTTS